MIYRFNMEQNFREMVEATIQKDMQELLNGPIKQTTDIIAQVYEMGLMKGLEIQRKNLQAAQPVKWVSVEERKPEGIDFVVVNNINMPCIQIALATNGKFLDPQGTLKPIENVTHWMPIPALEL